MEKPTPAMKQYLEIKAKYPDSIVFFRMGDFYETFYEDAKTTSRALDIALTRRGIKNSEQEIPLAGIPFHALDAYLPKMIKQGFKVAIVEQMEDPRFAKGIVKRDVTRVITPGTLIDEKLLTSSNNYIAAISIDKKAGLAIIDISTGEFIVSEFENLDQVLLELGKYRPGEVIVQSSLSIKLSYFVTVRDEFHFHLDNAKNTLLRHFKIQTLDGFGLKNKEICISAAGALMAYLHETQKTSLSHLNCIKFYSNKDHLVLDSTTIDNLELVSEKSSLFKVLNMTQTSMGNRKLKRNILSPLIDVQKINDRLNAVEELMNKHFILEELREYLKNISDLDRLISRINYGNSNPRDLTFLQGSLELIPEIKNLLSETQASLLENLSRFEDLSAIRELIDMSIKDDPPVLMDQGGFIKEGFSEELDEFRLISRNAKDIIRTIEEKERARTGIKSMKIRYNQIFGYFIEVTKANEHLVPKEYIRKQTMVNSDRFVTEELKLLEEKILTAEEKIISIEKNLFLDIVEKIKKETMNIQKISERIATIDVLCSFSKISSTNRYVKPIISKSYKLHLKKSRHPIIEKISDFIPNDVSFDENTRMMIITGPNMAGKSVYMKQVALNIIMAQVGCFCPGKLC